MKKHRLIWLDYDLRVAGIPQRCVHYELSTDSTVLLIVYLDKFFEKQFLTVFRTSKKAYRIFYNGQLITRQTAKASAEYLFSVLAEVLEQSERYHTMTVAELHQYDTLGFWKRLEIGSRGKKFKG